MGLPGNGQSCVPPGFRFHPTDEELLYYYLKKKVSYEMIDLNVIRDVDLNKLEPWDLHERCKIGSSPQNEWYFFSHKDKKYPTGTRTNRATAAGFWKATGRDKAIYMNFKRIGMRKTLVFYTGRAPHGQKTEWIMHEYRLEDSENPHGNEDGWVVCRVFKKRMHFKDSNDSEQRPSGSGNEEEQSLSIPQMGDSNTGEVVHNNMQNQAHFNSSHFNVMSRQHHGINNQHEDTPQFSNFNHEIFSQMPQLHSPDASLQCNPQAPAVIKNFIPDNLLDMNISRRPLSLDMNMNMGSIADLQTTMPQSLKFMQALTGDFRDDHHHQHQQQQHQRSPAEWSVLDRFIEHNNNNSHHHLGHEPQQQQQEHDKHLRPPTHEDNDQTHNTSPHALDLCSNASSLLRYHTNPESHDFPSAHAIEYWNFDK